MAWHWPGDKPLSEPMMGRLLTHMCVTRPQWDNDMRICCFPKNVFILDKSRFRSKFSTNLDFGRNFRKISISSNGPILKPSTLTDFIDRENTLKFLEVSFTLWSIHFPVPIFMFQLLSFDSNDFIVSLRCILQWVTVSLEISIILSYLSYYIEQNM